MIVMPRHVVTMVVMPFVVGLGLQPGFHVRRLFFGIVEPGIEQPRRGCFIAVRGEKPRRRIEPPHAPDDGEQHVLAFAAFQKIDLGEHHPVGNGNLLHRFRMRIERLPAIEGVDHGDDALEAAARQQEGFAHQRVQDRCRIGKACGFDHDAVEGLEIATVAPRQQVLHRIDQVAADGAAQAAG